MSCRMSRSANNKSRSFRERLLLFADALAVHDCLVHNLAYLPSRSVAARPECTVRIPGDDALGIGRLDVAEEGVARQHVAEVSRLRAQKLPAHRQHNHLG